MVFDCGMVINVAVVDMVVVAQILALLAVCNGCGLCRRLAMRPLNPVVLFPCFLAGSVSKRHGCETHKLVLKCLLKMNIVQ